MSRWILRGLSSGLKTTPFPRRDDVAASGAATTLQVLPNRLTGEDALRAAASCPTSALKASGDPERGTLRVDAAQCVLCGRCVRAAPAAFRLSTDPRSAVRGPERLRATVSWRGGRMVAASDAEDETRRQAEVLRRRARRVFRRSLHLRHVDAGSCNGCESELQMLLTPHYDLHRLGIFFTPTPRHADGLLVTGVVTRQMEVPLRRTYEAIPEPKLVVAAGVCAIGGGSFEHSPMVRSRLDEILPVDVYVPGCPPTPLALLHGLLLAVGRADERARLVQDGDSADGD